MAYAVFPLNYSGYVLVTLSAHKNPLAHLLIDFDFPSCFRHTYLTIQGVQAAVEVPVNVEYLPNGQS